MHIYIDPLNQSEASAATKDLLSAMIDAGEDIEKTTSLITKTITEGADINFLWEHEIVPTIVRKSSILELFVENFHDEKKPMMQFLLDQGANPLLNALERVIFDEEMQAAEAMIDACVKHNHRAPLSLGGYGVVGYLMSCTADQNVPYLIGHAIAQGADLSPPDGMNWAHVVLKSDDLFPVKPNSSLHAWDVSWKILEIALNLGADLLEPDSEGATPLDLLENCAAALQNASMDMAKKVRSAQQARDLALDTPIAPNARRPKRI